MRVLRVLIAVAYVGATALLWYVLEQPIEEAFSFEAWSLLFPVLSFVTALLIGRWWCVLLVLVLVPMTAPDWRSGCTELCSTHIVLAVISFSAVAFVTGMLVYMGGRELLSRRRSRFASPS